MGGFDDGNSFVDRDLSIQRAAFLSFDPHPLIIVLSIGYCTDNDVPDRQIVKSPTYAVLSL